MTGVYSVNEIRAAERAVMNAGVSEDELIGRAAGKLFDAALGFGFRRAVVLAGGGNNGSDALSLALLLHEAGRETAVVICSEKRNAYVSSRLEALAAAGVPVSTEMPALEKNDLVIDGIFGIGLSRDVTGRAAEIIRAVNASPASVLSVDVPSGLNADTGRIMGEAVEADVTVTFSALKQGLLLGGGRNCTGRAEVAEIGIPLGEPRMRVTEKEDAAMPPRRTVSNKGNYGSVKIIAGSPTMMGASLLAHESASAALRSGAGYAVLCVPESLQTAYQSRIKEEMLYFMPDIAGKITYNEPVLDKIMEKTPSIVIGMGLGKNPDLLKIIAYIARRFAGALVIDGDGLNALAADPDAVKGHTCRLILTPHVREFARLAGEDDALPDTERTRAFAEKLDAVVAMKSATTVISDGKRIYLNLTGTPAMAKAGSGDVLAGMTAAFAARLDPFDAAVRACYWFGKAGERAAAIRSETSILASDIIVETSRIFG